MSFCLNFLSNFLHNTATFVVFCLQDSNFHSMRLALNDYCYQEMTLINRKTTLQIIKWIKTKCLHEWFTLIQAVCKKHFYNQLLKWMLNVQNALKKKNYLHGLSLNNSPTVWKMVYYGGRKCFNLQKQGHHLKKLVVWKYSLSYQPQQSFIYEELKTVLCLFINRDIYFILYKTLLINTDINK